MAQHDDHAHHDHPTAPAHASYAAFRGHPLHPMVVPLPIGAFLMLLLSDLAFLGTGDAFWARASFWLLVVGILGGAVAGLIGLLDFTSIGHARNRQGQLHAWGNAAVLVVAIVNVYLRTADAAAPIAGWGVALTVLMVLMLAVTGWAGGELVYRHGVGLVPDRRR